MLASVVSTSSVRRFSNDQFTINDFFFNLRVLAVQNLIKQKFGRSPSDFFRELVDGTYRRVHVA